jgi:hypothetical protein
MNENEKSCSVCNQRFKTDRELQEHQRTAHSQEQEKSRPGSERNVNQPSQGDQKKERVA